MDNTIKYKLYIERSNTYEELSMALYGSNSYYVATNMKLTNTGTNPGEIKDTKTLQLFTRNLNTVSNGTFLLQIYSDPVVTDVSGRSNVFSVIALVLFVLMAIFICICAICIVRICMKKRRYEQNILNQVRERE